MASLTSEVKETLKTGPLDKLGHIVKSWKNRFFVLEDRSTGVEQKRIPYLVYYRGSGVGMNAGAKGELCLDGAKVFRPAQVHCDERIHVQSPLVDPLFMPLVQDDPDNKYFNFEVLSPNGQNLKLRATTSELRSEWMDMLSSAIEAAAPAVEVFSKKGLLEKNTVRQQSATSNGQWKSRYFELEQRTSNLGVETFLVYYVDTAKMEPPKGALGLSNAFTVRPDRDDPASPFFQFTLNLDDGRALDLRCGTAAEREEWCEAMEAAVALCAAKPAP
jgi:hypothetical protein